MLLPGVLEEAVLIKRYKRFLADVQLKNGETVVVHCPNPGSMIGCAEPGSRVILRQAAPQRKLPYTWIVTLAGKTFINVDTLLANKLVLEALRNKHLPEFSQYEDIAPEFTFGDSRFDFALCKRTVKKKTAPECLIEVKSTTLAQGSCAMFPDAKTERGRKHLKGLIEARRQGIRAVQFFCISRNDARSFSPAAHIDPLYAEALKEAVDAGVEAMAWTIKVERQGASYLVSLDMAVPVVI